MSPGGGKRSGRPGSSRHRRPAAGEPAAMPSQHLQGGRKRGAAKGARPLLGRNADGRAHDSPSPSARKAAPPAGLVASLHPGPRSRSLAPARRGVRTREARGAHGVRTGVQVPGCHRGAPLRAAPCFAPPGPRTPNRTRPGRIEAEGRRGADASKRGRAGARSPAPRDLSPSPPASSAGSASPAPPTPAWRRSAARPLPFRPWRVWKGGFGAGGGSGGGPGGGAVSAAGPSSAPPGLSLSLLLPPPAPGGARHGGAGARQARYGDVEIGDPWCGEVGWGGQGVVRIGRARDGETLGSRTRGRGGVPGNLGALDGEGNEAARFGTNREGRGRQ